MQRRNFLKSSLAAVGSSVALQRDAFSQEEEKPPSEAGGNPFLEVEDLKIAFLGLGAQGRTLLDAVMPLPDIRIVALCDSWPFRLRAAEYYLEMYDRPAATYDDYRTLLEEETSLDAVIVATPDFCHPEQTIACLEAGAAVYCEPLMADTLEGARSMVEASCRTGVPLQVGHQRRSSPLYRYVLEKLVHRANLFGRWTHLETRWNRPLESPAGWPRRHEMPEKKLETLGYADMHQYCNWRYFRKYSAGECAFHLAQQLDVADWFFDTVPESLLADGGNDVRADRENPDHLSTLVDYPMPEGTLQTNGQVVLTSSGGFDRNFEHFLGLDGSVQMTENPDWTRIFREPYAPDWNTVLKQGDLVPAAGKTPSSNQPGEGFLVSETSKLTCYRVPIVLESPVSGPHLENFFAAVRGKQQLHAPGEAAFRATALALSAREAGEKGRKKVFTSDDFQFAGDHTHR
jgi:predicted dehydrogenase